MLTAAPNGGEEMLASGLGCSPVQLWELHVSVLQLVSIRPVSRHLSVEGHSAM